MGSIILGMNERRSTAPMDVAFAALAFGLLVVARMPPWLVVLAGAAAGQGLGALGVG